MVDTRRGRMQDINVSMAYKLYKRIQVKQSDGKSRRTSNDFLLPDDKVTTQTYFNQKMQQYN